MDVFSRKYTSKIEKYHILWTFMKSTYKHLCFSFGFIYIGQNIAGEKEVCKNNHYFDSIYIRCYELTWYDNI